MTTHQKITVSMYMALRNFVNLNKEIAMKNPKFAKSYETFMATVDEIQIHSEIQGANKTGIAIDKNTLKKKLIGMAIKNSKKIAIIAKLKDNETLYKEVNFNESDLLRMAEVTLKDRAELIYDRVEANIAELAEQGITEDTQKLFLDTITAFNNALSTPRTGITERGKITQKLSGLFDAADNAIEIMDLVAGSIKDEEPDFYNGYRNTRKLVETSAGKLALTATATDITNGEPVKGVLFTFKPLSVKGVSGNGAGEMTKKTAQKGSFKVKNMPAGNYNVSVSKPGYKDKEVTVIVVDGERSDLAVELEKA
jgi:Carboxypeptidase regulatory-like domain